MKTIIYILALVVIGAAGFFSYKNIQPHQEELDLTTKLEGENAQLRVDIKGLVKQVSDQKTVKNAEQTKKNDLVNTIDLQKGKKRNLVKQSQGFDGELDNLKEKKAEIDRVVAEIEKLAGEVGVTIDRVPAYFEELQEKKKQLNKTHNSLLAEVERLDSEVEAKKKEVAALKAAEVNRRKNLKSNGVSSLITAVDRDWGFVIIKPHTDALIKQDSQLIVVRGDRHVGRLSINAIEEGRVLANIDYGSIVSGLRIRPGDRVILSKSVTR